MEIEEAINGRNHAQQSAPQRTMQLELGPMHLTAPEEQLRRETARRNPGPTHAYAQGKVICNTQ